MVLVPRLDCIRPLREVFDAQRLDKRARHEVIYGGHKQLQRRVDEEGCGAVILAARLYVWLQIDV